MTPITPRGIELNLDAARPLDAIRVARDLVRTTRVAALATLDPSGYPYCTVTNLAVEPDGTPVVFMAWLAIHARNIEADPRVSITMADHATDVMTTPRLTLTGRAERVTGAEIEPLKARYADRFPKSKLYLALPDALLYRIRTEGVQLNGGPAQNANSVRPEDLLTDLAPAAALMAEAPSLLVELNAQGLPERIARAAGARVEAGAGRWKVTSLDPEGVDLSTADALARLWFPARADTRGTFDAALTAALSTAKSA